SIPRSRPGLAVRSSAQSRLGRPGPSAGTHGSYPAVRLTEPVGDVECGEGADDARHERHRLAPPPYGRGTACNGGSPIDPGLGCEEAPSPTRPGRAEAEERERGHEGERRDAPSTQHAPVLSHHRDFPEAVSVVLLEQRRERATRRVENIDRRIEHDALSDGPDPHA